MNAVRCQRVLAVPCTDRVLGLGLLAVPCTDRVLGLGLQKGLFPYYIYTLQFDITCSHHLVNDIVLQSAGMNALLNVLLLLYNGTRKVKVKVKIVHNLPCRPRVRVKSIDVLLP